MMRPGFMRWSQRLVAAIAPFQLGGFHVSMKHKPGLTMSLTAIAAACILAGCGGDDNAPANNGSASNGTTYSGVVAASAYVPGSATGNPTLKAGYYSGATVFVDANNNGVLDSGEASAKTDANGYYRFVTIKPGAYPWGNHPNAWRPAHIHFSLFGHSFISRIVTQMYFPGDPLFAYDPIFNSVADEKARMRMVSSFDLENTKPDWALCYRFDIVLRGRNATPLDND